MDIDQLKAVIKEALDERIKEFYIDRETHYQDHQFIKELRDWTESIKSTTIKTVVGLFVAALIGLLLL
ncbi:MAG: hypothetical protein HRF42_08980 [Candidatus Brocadia sp.]|jgi:L-lactate utilization protein LutB